MSKPPPIKIVVDEGIKSEAVIFDEPVEEDGVKYRDAFNQIPFPEKKSDTLIIQSCVPTHGPFDEALDWLKPIHGTYCRKWGYDYVANSQPVIELYEEEDKAKFSHAWDKIILIAQALVAEYEYVFWIDHDCVIVDFKSDLRDAFDDAARDIMMCVHPGFPQGGLPSHFNAGVMAVRNTERTREFFQEVINHRYSGPPWFEQDVMNALFRDFAWMDIVGVMGDRFNSTPNANQVPIEQAVIAAFHGVGGYHDVNTRLDYMKEAAQIREVEKQMQSVK